MPMLQRLRRMFSPGSKDPVTIDLVEHAGASQDSPSPTPPTDRDDQRDGEATALAPRSARPRSLGEIQRGYDEVMGLVRKISDHLDQQTERTEKVVDLLDRLPTAIDALPEINRQNSRLLDVLSDHLEQTRNRESALNTTLNRLTENSTHQTEVLGLLQQQLDASSRTAEQMSETMDRFRDALANLAATSNRSTELLSRMMESTNQRESRLEAMFEHAQRWIIGSAIFLSVLAMVGLVIAVIALLR